MAILEQRLLKALQLTDDFLDHIEESSLALMIPNVPSNTIGDQVYCIIGARESYLEALKAGEWVGFVCSLTDITDKETSVNIEEYLEDTPIENKNLLFDLLEHEVQHHGQLIRFAYANKILFPKSWNTRYTV